MILATGIRIGEAIALTWDNINFEEKILQVNKTYVHVIDPDTRELIKGFSSPKTKTSNRTIPLLPNALQYFKDLKKEQDEWKLECGDYYKDHNLVFCTQKGMPLIARNMCYYFHVIAKKAEIEGAHIHCLRHTFATRGLENGIELKVMQEFLGQ